MPAYVESGKKKAEEQYGDCWNDFLQLSILPISSDPTHEDGDRDEISDELDGEALLSNKHYGIFVNYINEQKIEFDDVISDGKVSICTIPITELGFEIGFESFVCYDEYGDYYETDMFNKKKIINGYFDNWYLIAKNDNEMISYGVAYTENCQEFVNKYSDPFKVFSKAIDSYIMSIETIYNGYIEDGIWKASWDNFTGRLSAYAESAVKDIGTLADVINVIRQRFSPKPSSSLYFSPSIENDFSNQSYEAKWTYAYQKFEEKHLNSDSDTFMASKTIGYTEQMMYDVGMMFVGGFVGTGGEILVYGSVAAAPETLGTSLVIAIPAEAVAIVGAGVTATGTILLASDTNGYNQASQAMRDAHMFADTTVKTGKYASWSELKSAYSGNVTKFIKEHKPKRSPDIKKWFDKDGTIDIQIIDGKEIWTYTSSDGTSVPYIDGYVNFPKKYLHPDIQNGISIGKFTGDRNKDIKLAMEVLKQEYGLSKIPDGYVVHHDVENGLLQIVEKSVHEMFTHVGGYSLYK